MILDDLNLLIRIVPLARRRIVLIVKALPSHPIRSVSQWTASGMSWTRLPQEQLLLNLRMDTPNVHPHDISMHMEVTIVTILTNKCPLLLQRIGIVCLQPRLRRRKPD